MNKCLLILFFTAARLVPCMAQVPPPPQGEPDPAIQQARFQQLQALKVGFISPKLNLNEAEGNAFWPVYFQYEKEVRLARSNNAADEISREEAVLEVRKRYQGQFNRILGQNRTRYFFQLERDFNQVLINRMTHRPGPAQRFPMRKGF